MWIKHYLPKSHIKTVALGAVVLLVLMIITTISVDLTLNKSQGSFRNEWKKICPYELNFADITYNFPQRVLLKNVTLKKEVPETAVFAFSKQVDLYFSLFDIIIHRKLLVVSFTIQDLQIYDSQYVYDHRKEVTEFLKQLPKNDFEVKAPNTLIYLTVKPNEKQFIKSDLTLTMHKDVITGKGIILKESPLAYDFQGFFNDKRFSLKYLFIHYGLYDIRVWGKSGQAAGAFAKVKEKLRYLIHAPKPAPNPYQYEINTDVDVMADKLDIKRIDFIHQGVPVYISGQIFWTDALRYQLASSMNFTDADIAPLKDVTWMKVNLAGQWEDDTIKNDGHLSLVLSPVKNKKEQIEKVEMDLKEFTATISSLSKVNFNLKKTELSVYSRKETQHLVLENLKGRLIQFNDDHRLIKFYAPLYGGLLKGRLSLRNFDHATKVILSTRFKDVDMHQLAGSMKGLPQLGGQLDGKIVFKNFPEQNLSGEVKLDGAHMTDVQCLNKFVDYFDIPSFGTLSLVQASSHFKIDAKGVNLKEMTFKSVGIDFKGELMMSHDQFVKSQFSLWLSKELMEKSRFRPLVKMVNDPGPFQFDFKLSGSMDSLNFQWTSSDLKQKIQDKIPNFIERRIEQKIEQALDDVSLK